MKEVFSAPIGGVRGIWSDLLSHSMLRIDQPIYHCMKVHDLGEQNQPFLDK